MIARNRWIRGITAGLLGAAAMAFWFLVIDASRGAPFRTPSLLASSLVGVEGLQSRPGLIALYTVIHFAAFAAVGALVTWILPRTDAAPGMLLGLVVGFILFDLAFYGSVWATGFDVVGEIGWVEVLVGNLLAGLVLMGYLHMSGTVRPVTWWDALGERRVVREGLVAGLLGATAVVFWFLVVDLARGTPFFTPGALGSTLFLGAASAEAVVVNGGTVAGYTVVHYAAFLVVGLIASAATEGAEESPTLILGAVLLFVTFEALFLGLLAIVAEYLLGSLAWWTIAVGNGLAVLAMGAYLWQRHPLLARALASDPFEDEAG